MDTLIGQVINNFEIKEIIGKGGMGIVYRAHHPELETDVAVKVLRAELARQPGFYERFLQEARTAARLDHPNIAKVTNFGQFDDQYYLMMEFIDGISLRDLLRDNKQGIPISDIIQIFLQIADVLAFAHQSGVLHRDLKPDNILLTDSIRAHLPYRAVITDFGLVKLAENSLLETQRGISVGTPAYMPPEQCRGEEVDGRADIYSLGVMLYEAVTGKRPYPIRNLFDAAKYHKSGELIPLKALKHDVPIRLDNLVQRMLSPDKKHRPADADEVIHILEKIAGEVGEEVEDVQQSAVHQALTSNFRTSPEINTLRESDSKPSGATTEEGESRFAVRVLRDDHNEDRTLPLRPGGRLTVGRRPDHDIVLIHPTERYVSKEHCEILLQDGRVLVRDLGSTNGSYLNGLRLDKDRFYEWPSDQQVQLGPYTLFVVEKKVDMARPATPPAEERPPTPANLPVPEINCPEGSPASLMLVNNAPVVLGRLDSCDMTLNNPRVSKNHCRIMRRGERVEVTDLNSTNGTFLDTQRLPAGSPVVWQPGVPLRLGVYTVTLNLKE